MTDSGAAIVITCYELGATLPDAVASALAQTLPAREVIVVDDGSTGPLTRQVVDGLARGEPRVRVVRSEHRGAAHARNVGMRAASAPLAVFLDGDDLFEPTYLEQAAALLRDREDVSFVCCALQAFGRACYRWKPPPYTAAEALGRGACGHISAVFRRAVWDDVGGFDERLPAYEDVDFWLRALRAGHRGVILDDALLRYRVRRGSRYHTAIMRGDYLPAKQLLLERHLEADGVRGEDVFATILDFERELRAHGRMLDGDCAELEGGLAVTERETQRAREMLREREVPAFDWGLMGAPQGAPAAVEDALRRRAVDDLAPRPRPRRTLVVGAGDPWPDPSRAAYDLVVVDGALEHEPDLHGALRRCRAALRPGGRLVVAAGCLALDEDRLRGLTQAALRSLLCELFPAARVRTAAYGNLVTCLGHAAAAPVDALTGEELERVDPDHPTVVAGWAAAPVNGRRRPGPRRSQTPDPPIHGGQRAPRGRAAVLAYHRIADERPDTHGLCTPPDLFAAHIELIAARFEPVALTELVARATAGSLAAGAVAVTFDDGYLDNLEVASPIIERLGLPATFFVNGAPPPTPTETWWDTVERLLLGEERVPQRLRLDVAGQTVDLPTTSAEERRAALLALHGRLLTARSDQVGATLARLADWSGRRPAPRDTHRLMTAEELVELAARPGHRIGAHGLTHRMLPDLPPETQEHELAASKADLEALLGAAVDAVAYPYGACDLATIARAEAAGFAVGCTVEPDPVTPDSDPLRIPRLVADGLDLPTLQWRLERTLTAAA